MSCARSLDEVGRLDLPAVLRLVLQKSGQRSATFIGHSMGASTLSVMASTSSDSPQRQPVSRAYMLAPAAYMGHASMATVYGSASAVTSLHVGAHPLCG